jgi:hypothetical protein
MTDPLARCTYPERVAVAAADFLCNAFAAPTLTDATKNERLIDAAMCILNETMWIQPSDAQVASAYSRDTGDEDWSDEEGSDEPADDEPDGNE